MGKKPVKAVAKKPTKKRLTKAEFTVTLFTERGARSHKQIYERAGYKFVKSKITPDQIFLTFEEKD